MRARRSLGEENAAGIGCCVGEAEAVHGDELGLSEHVAGEGVVLDDVALEPLPAAVSGLIGVLGSVRERSQGSP